MLRGRHSLPFSLQERDLVARDCLKLSLVVTIRKKVVIEGSHQEHLEGATLPYLGEDEEGEETRVSL